MLDLSSIMPRKDEDDHYDLILHQLYEMPPHQIDAHIRSMKHSQMADYGKKLRVVIDADRFGERFGHRRFSAPPDTIRASDLPLTRAAFDVPDEVVIRASKNPGQEYLLKSRDGETGWRTIKGTTAAQNPVQTAVETGKPVTPDTPVAPSGRAWNWDD